MQQLLVPYESFGHLRSSGTRLLCVHRTKTEHSEAAFSFYASLFSAFHLDYLQNEGATKNELKRYEKLPPSRSARQAVELFRRLATVASWLTCGRMHCKYCRLCSFNELDYWGSWVRQRFSYLEVFFLEHERWGESAPRFGKVDLNETVSLLPRCLPESAIGLPHNNESFLQGGKKKKVK